MPLALFAIANQLDWNVLKLSMPIVNTKINFILFLFILLLVIHLACYQMISN